jgi:hypothetical protein
MQKPESLITLPGMGHEGLHTFSLASLSHNDGRLPYHVAHTWSHPDEPLKGIQFYTVALV